MPQIDQKAPSILLNCICFGRKITLLTDHCGLATIFRHGHTAISCHLNAKVALLLSAHPCDIKYWKPEFHANAGSLSRPPLLMTSAVQKKEHIFQFLQLEEVPFTSAQVCQHRRNVPTLFTLMDIVVNERNEEDTSELNSCVLKQKDLGLGPGLCKLPHFFHETGQKRHGNTFTMILSAHSRRECFLWMGSQNGQS